MTETTTTAAPTVTGTGRIDPAYGWTVSDQVPDEVAASCLYDSAGWLRGWERIGIERRTQMPAIDVDIGPRIGRHFHVIEHRLLNHRQRVSVFHFDRKLLAVGPRNQAEGFCLDGWTSLAFYEAQFTR